MPAVLKSVHASRVKERACQTFYMLVCVCVSKTHESSRRQLVPFFRQSPFRTFRQTFQCGFVVDTFVKMFEMEIVEKKGLVADGCMSLMMIALGCLSRTQPQSNRMKNSMPAVLKSVHASRVKERACQPC